MPADLKIRVSADVLQAIAGMKQLGTELNSTGNISAQALDKIASSFGKVDPAVSNAVASFEELKAAQQELASLPASRFGVVAPKGVTREFANEIAFFGGALKNTNPAADKFVTSVKSINAANAAAAAKTKALQEAVTSFGGGVKNTNAATDFFVRKVIDFNAAVSLGGTAAKQTERQIASLGQTSSLSLKGIADGAQKAFSALRFAAQVLPGIGIAGILGGAVTAIASLFTETEKQKKAAKEAAEENDKYVKSIQGIISQTSDEAGRVSELVVALKSETLTKQEKKAAIEELSRINPEYFGQLSKEKDFVSALNLAYRLYISSLKQAFAAKALDKQLSTLFDKKLSLEVEVDPKIRSLTQSAQNSQQLNRLRGEFERLGGIKAFNEIPIDTILEGKLTPVQKKLVDLKDIVTELSNVRFFDPDLENKQKELLNINKQIDGLLSKRGELSNFDIKVTGDKTPEEIAGSIEALKNKIKSLSDTILKLTPDLRNSDVGKNLAIELKKSKEELKKLEIEFALAQEKIKGTKKKIPLGALLEIKPSLPTPQSIIQFQQDIDDIVNGIFKSKINTSNATKGIELKPSVTLNPDILIPDTFFRATGERFDDVVKKINDILKTSAIDGITGLAEGIGQAISGEGNPFSGFISVLAQGLQDLGKYLISIAPVIASIKLALKSLDPKILLVGGIALIAIGAALKSTLGKGVKAFATGGIVTGPTNALIGEAGPEVVFPLNQLNRFLGGVGGQRMEFDPVVFEIYGDRIRGLLNKTDRTQSRI